MYNVNVTTTIDRKSYEQICPMATALDYVGDRWTILLLRELLGGSARFQQLRDGLPGIATNLLTERLRRMEADGLVRRSDVAGSPLYSLTEAGEGIRTAIEELGMWGARMARVGPPTHDRSVRAIAMALHSILVRSRALPTSTVVVEAEIGEEFIEIVLGPEPSALARTAARPDARVESRPEHVSELLLGSRSGQDAFTLLSGDGMARDALIAALA
jgi:DNA-binding HxlR family transcriptional regulator